MPCFTSFFFVIYLEPPWSSRHPFKRGKKHCRMSTDSVLLGYELLSSLSDISVIRNDFPEHEKSCCWSLDNIHCSCLNVLNTGFFKWFPRPYNDIACPVYAWIWTARIFLFKEAQLVIVSLSKLLILLSLLVHRPITVVGLFKRHNFATSDDSGV